MDEILIEHIKNGIITDRWCNKIGLFEYNNSTNSYRFIEINKDGSQYLHAIPYRTEENTPVVIKGFIAFLVANWGDIELDIYNKYNHWSYDTFRNSESKKAGAFKRNLKKEFGVKQINTELGYIEDFTNNFEYLPQIQKNIILEYANNYIEYTSNIYKINNNANNQEAKFTDLLSHNNIDQLMIVLREQIKGAKGKKVAAIIKALQKLNLLKPYNSVSQLHRMIQVEFGDIGSVENFRNYINDTTNYNLEQSTIDSYIKLLQEI